MVKQAKKSFFMNALKNKNAKQVWENIRYIVPGKSKNANIGCIKTDMQVKCLILRRLLILLMNILQV